MGLYRIEAFGSAQATIIHDLPWPPHLTGHDDVALSNRPTVNANACSKTVHDSFHGELRLVGTETTESTTHGIVRPNSDGFYVDVGHLVRAAGMASHPL